MRIAHKIKKIVTHEQYDDTVTLTFEARFLRRRKLVSDGGESFLVELSETKSIEEGQGFLLDDGRVFLIQSACESLLKIRHRQLARIAWHIGNRHTPCQMGSDYLVIRKDQVLEELLKRLGAKIEAVNAPFTPEGGAYGHGRTHGHEHHHSET